MPDNKYISRYNAGETRFPRLDATPHIPFEEDEPSLGRKILHASVFAGLLAAVILTLLVAQ